jgi:hypothetical protein
MVTCFSEASFLGEWDKNQAPDDPITARLCTGYAIMYASCLIVWSSKLQLENAHSATKAEYIAISQSLKEDTALMYLLQEHKQANWIST